MKYEEAPAVAFAGLDSGRTFAIVPGDGEATADRPSATRGAEVAEDENIIRARLLAIRKLGLAPGMPTSGIILALVDRVNQLEKAFDGAERLVRILRGAAGGGVKGSSS